MWGNPTHKEGNTKKKNKKTKAKGSLFKSICRAQRRSPPPPDEWVFRYLEVVYRIRIKFTSAEIRQALGADDWVKSLRKKPTAVALLIGATAGAHITKGLRWKYANVLEFARKNELAPKELREFIRTNGGINGCVQKHRQLLRQKVTSTLVR